MTQMPDMAQMTVIAASGLPLPATPFIGRHLIAGQWQDSADGATFDRHSPAHGTVVILNDE